MSDAQRTLSWKLDQLTLAAAKTSGGIPPSERAVLPYSVAFPEQPKLEDPDAPTQMTACKPLVKKRLSQVRRGALKNMCTFEVKKAQRGSQWVNLAAGWDMRWGEEETQWEQSVHGAECVADVEALLPAKWLNFNAAQERAEWDNATVDASLHRAHALCTATIQRLGYLAELPAHKLSGRMYEELHRKKQLLDDVAEVFEQLPLSLEGGGLFGGTDGADGADGELDPTALSHRNVEKVLLNHWGDLDAEQQQVVERRLGQEVRRDRRHVDGGALLERQPNVKTHKNTKPQHRSNKQQQQQPLHTSEVPMSTSSQPQQPALSAAPSAEPPAEADKPDKAAQGRRNNRAAKRKTSRSQPAVVVEEDAPQTQAEMPSSSNVNNSRVANEEQKKPADPFADLGDAPAAAPAAPAPQQLPQQPLLPRARRVVKGRKVGGGEGDAA